MHDFMLGWILAGHWCSLRVPALDVVASERRLRLLCGNALGQVQ